MVILYSFRCILCSNPTQKNLKGKIKELFTPNVASEREMDLSTRFETINALQGLQNPTVFNVDQIQVLDKLALATINMDEDEIIDC